MPATPVQIRLGTPSESDGRQQKADGLFWLIAHFGEVAIFL
jgi:hypothetical protein